MPTTRRAFLKSTALAAVAGAATEAPARDHAPAGAANAHDSTTGTTHEHGNMHAPAYSGGLERAGYLFFEPAEAAFIEAAVERLIPSDASGPGAREAGVAAYLDRQLGGAWGAGERLYRSGPWQAGTPSQGYQLPFTPAELFRNALRAIDAELKPRGGFARLGAERQDAWLDALHGSDRDLGGVPANVFFESLLAMTIEGFFSDPVYGGNRDMVSWKAIGFPGGTASYYDLVDRHGYRYDRPPLSIGDDGRGHVAMPADIPASINHGGR
ncbi:gluconate 2-dehydrogenase subunit 3 family protein [Derxia gummosa]|uniref:Gluconate 2-dehydrogenase subunit 3 family protein n=1 Tax=Derxia gummosa DSM 723 TaxID=1121388 RepID=A0A8B6XBW9_9BURK|nr:gluconate 2-dehydrogenase subunit 3 family protein [Derxia gummosa]